MERGISLNYTMPKIIAKEVEDQFKSILKNKSYQNDNIKYDLGYNYNEKLDNIFIPILNKLIKFMKFYKNIVGKILECVIFLTVLLNIVFWQNHNYH